MHVLLMVLGQDPCPCAFDIVDMVPYTISKLSAKSQFCAIQTADNTDGKVRIEIILFLENNKMLPRKIKTEKYDRIGFNLPRREPPTYRMSSGDANR